MSPGWADKFLKAWITRTLRSRIPSLKKFALTLRQNQENILSFIKNPVTNAKGEGINRLLKILKNRSSGFKSLSCFIDMIYLTVGDVDIMGRYPQKFYTL